MQKITWVIGAPRSGTSFITDYIGTKTDYCFNEPWEEYPLGKHKEWKLPSQGTIVFKYCANCFYYEEIKNLYPESKWVHVIREPIFVLYSMVFPKKDAVPERKWPRMGQGEKRILNCLSQYKNMLDACLKIKECKIVKYEQIDYKNLSEFLELNLDKPNFINKNEIFEIEKMNLLKKYYKNFKFNIL